MPKKVIFLIIYFLHQTVYNLSSQKEFSLFFFYVFFFVFPVQIARFSLHFSLIYTIAFLPGLSHNVLQFKFVRNENKKKILKSFFLLSTQKKLNPPKVFFARLQENWVWKVFSLSFEGERKSVSILCATRTIDSGSLLRSWCDGQKLIRKKLQIRRPSRKKFNFFAISLLFFFLSKNAMHWIQLNLIWFLLSSLSSLTF